MRKLSIIIVLALLLNSCYSTVPCSTQQVATNFLFQQKVVATTKHKYRPKNPKYVTLYKQQKLLTPYRVIGVATISKYNILGEKRPQEVINDMFKNLAAELGGDALINITNKGDSIQGHIIQFQKLVL